MTTVTNKISSDATNNKQDAFNTISPILTNLAQSVSDAPQELQSYGSLLQKFKTAEDAKAFRKFFATQSFSGINLMAVRVGKAKRKILYLVADTQFPLKSKWSSIKRGSSQDLLKTSI